MTGFAQFLNNTFAGFDGAVFELCYSLHQSAGALLDPFFKFITVFGNHGLFFIFVGLVLTFIPRTRKAGMCTLFALLIGALITNVCLKELVARARPYEMLDIAKRLWESVGNGPESDLSFPSGHATASCAFCVGIFLTCRKKLSWPILVFGGLICLSRLYIGVHYATDVIAGMLIGTLGAFGALWCANKLYPFVSHLGKRKKPCDMSENRG